MPEGPKVRLTVKPSLARIEVVIDELSRNAGFFADLMDGYTFITPL